MKYLVILFIMLSCADVKTPEERGIEVNYDIIGVYNQSKAMFTAQYMIEDEYHQDFGNLWSEATVYWTDTICPKDGLYKVIYEHECYYGRMWSCDEIYVAVSNLDTYRTTGSALVHEFGHCLYIQMYGHGNAKHDDKRFWGTIDKALLEVSNRGW